MDIPSPPPPQHHLQPSPQLTTTPPQTTPTPTPTSPSPRIQQIPKQLPPPFTNGVLKRHKPRHHHHHNLTPPVVISYKECLKNHAASMGGHAVDGCGEFMPSPTSTPTDPTSLKCAACGCHRNFHRRDPDELFHNNIGYPPPQHVIEYQPLHRHHPPPPPPVQPISIGGVRGNSLSPADSPSPPPISSSYYPTAPHMLLALSSAPPENTHTHTHTHNNSSALIIGSNSNGKKRFRTKFTQDQKQKMHELAERVGWKMQKKDEDIIIGCCNEIGVEKGVFKVWMHNNKMTLGNKKESGNDNGSSGGAGGVGGGIDFLTNHQHQRQPPLHINTDSVSSGGGVGGNAIGTNGSSSSS